MTISDLLPLVQGDVGIRAHAVLPDNIDNVETHALREPNAKPRWYFLVHVRDRGRLREFNRGPGSRIDETEDVRRLRVALAIYVPQRHTAALLLYRDLRTRRAGEGHHGRLGLGLRKSK